MSAATRAIALLVAALAVVTAVAIVAITRDEPASRPALPPFQPGGGFPTGVPLRPITVAAEITPRVHLWGDPITPRVIVHFDPRQIVAESINTNPDFRPYEFVSDPTVEREVVGDVGRAVFTYRLRCVAKACATEDPTQEILFPSGRVDYRAPESSRPNGAIFSWPEVQSVSRVGALDISNPQWRADVRSAPPLSYRGSPGLLATGLFALAALLGLAGVLLLRVTRPRRAVVEEEVVEEQRRLAPIERALAVLVELGANGSHADRRKALELLARELREVDEPDLADRARRLAWSQQHPSTGEADALADDVRARTGAE